jgi:hypothetical protein
MFVVSSFPSQGFGLTEYKYDNTDLARYNAHESGQAAIPDAEKPGPYTKKKT